MDADIKAWPYADSNPQIMQRCTNDNESCIQTIERLAACRSSNRAMTQSAVAIRNKLKAHNVSRYNWLHEQQNAPGDGYAANLVYMSTSCMRPWLPFKDPGA